MQRSKPNQYLYIVRETENEFNVYFHKTSDKALARSRALARRNIHHTIMDERGNYYETGTNRLVLKY